APPRAFGPQVRIDLSATGGLTDGQRRHLDALMEKTVARMGRSKELTAKHRHHLADPRVVSGWKPLYKEMIFPIVVDRSKGARLWDLDGNQYVDLTCGFGADYFGHSPDFVIDAIKAQLDRGMEIGPQTPLAGEVADLICDLTGMERVAYCNTGSE